MPRRNKRRGAAQGLSAAGKAMSRIAEQLRQHRIDAKDDAARQRQLDMAEERLNMAQQQLDMEKDEHKQNMILKKFQAEMAEFQLGELPKEVARVEEESEYKKSRRPFEEAQAEADLTATQQGNTQRQREIKSQGLMQDVFDMKTDLDKRSVQSFTDDLDWWGYPESYRQEKLTEWGRSRGAIPPREEVVQPMRERPKGVTATSRLNTMKSFITSPYEDLADRGTMGAVALTDSLSAAAEGRPMLSPFEQQHRMWIQEVVSDPTSNVTREQVIQAMIQSGLTEEQAEKILFGIL